MPKDAIQLQNRYGNLLLYFRSKEDKFAWKNSISNAVSAMATEITVSAANLS